MDNSSEMVQPLGDQQVEKELPITDNPLSKREESDIRLGIKTKSGINFSPKKNQEETDG
jgi:hypothetical protein